MESGGKYIYYYMREISSRLHDLCQPGLLPQTTKLEMQVHPFKVGNWALIKTWKEESLRPRWEGPCQVLLTMETAVRTQEHGWMHHSRVKGPVEPPKENKWNMQGSYPKFKITRQ